MNYSSEVLTQAISPVGTKAVSASMGLSESLIYKWQQSQYNSGTAISPLERVVELHQLTKDDAIIQWICQETGGVFVKDDLTGGVDPLNLFAGLQDIILEFSDMISAINLSKEDGEIDNIETVKIRTEWMQMKAATERFVRSCERGIYMNKEKK